MKKFIKIILVRLKRSISPKLTSLFFSILPSVLPLFLTDFVYQPMAFAAVDPEIVWQTISTPHFEVIYDAKHYETAKMYALRLEFNHKNLMTYYQEAPEKTIVILNDNTDLANGYATPIPYPHIMIYPVLPSSHDTISEYSDWPQDLTLHEYTHILNFTPVHGVMGVLRAGLGSIVAPTLLLPRWWHEGVAVEMETRFSSYGRLRSLFQDATLRALVKAQQLSLYTIADINESDLETWPRGGRPYLFGSLLLSEIQGQKGGSINHQLLQRFSSRVPYFINAPVEDETQRDFEEWFRESLNQTTTRVYDQLAKIQTAPVTEFTPLTKDYLESHSPQFSPNGRYFSFVAKNTWGKSSIQIFDRQDAGRPFDLKEDSISEFLSLDNKSTGDKKDAPPAGNINRLSWLPDSTGFIFDQVRFIDSYSNFSDLFYYDLKNKKNQRLTSGLRLRDPHLSPDAHWVAAVQLFQSHTQLVILPLVQNKPSKDSTPSEIVTETPAVATNNLAIPNKTIGFTIEKPIDAKELQVLYTPPALHKIANPLFVDSHTLLFTERTLQGQIFLKKIDLNTKSITPILLNKLTQVDSLNSENGGISFIARENGMQNLYWTDNLFKTTQRLTHTDTAVFDGSIDSRSKSIYSTLMTETGLQVVRTSWPEREMKDPPPLVGPLFQDRYPSQNSVPNTAQNPAQNTSQSTTPPFTMPTQAELESQFGAQLTAPAPYSSLKYLRPYYWLPFIYSSENGYGVQISTSSFDPLEKHAYSIEAGYDSFNKETTGAFNYTNTTTHWPISLTLLNQTRPQPVSNTTYEAQQINLIASHDLRPWSEDMTFGFGVDALSTKTSSIKRKAGPQLLFIYDGAAKSSYSRKPFSGWQFSLLGNHYVKTKELSQLTRAQSKASFFYSNHLPERHIASLHLMAQEMKGEYSLADFASSNIYPFNPNLFFPAFVLRGYDTGYFYIKSARSLTAEYTFPLTSFLGFGTLPAFLKRSSLNLYGEILAVDGIVNNLAANAYDRAYLKNNFRSYGLEIKGDTTIGYYLPMTVLLGIYQRPDYSGPDKTTSFIGIQM